MAFTQGLYTGRSGTKCVSINLADRMKSESGADRKKTRTQKPNSHRLTDAQLLRIKFLYEVEGMKMRDVVATAVAEFGMIDDRKTYQYVSNVAVGTIAIHLNPWQQVQK